MAAASRKSSLVQTSQVRLCTSATLQHATRRGRRLGNGWARSPTRSGRCGSLEIAARVAQSHHHSCLKEGLVVLRRRLALLTSRTTRPAERVAG